MNTNTNFYNRISFFILNTSRDAGYREVVGALLIAHRTSRLFFIGGVA